MSGYEYGIRFRDLTEPHREGMTEQEARDWLAMLPEIGVDVEAFSVIRRPVGEWAAVSDTSPAVGSPAVGGGDDE